MLTKKEIAEKLKVSEATIDRWVRERGMPHYRVGRTVRFDWEKVQAWMVK